MWAGGRVGGLSNSLVKCPQPFVTWKVAKHNNSAVPMCCPSVAECQVCCAICGDKFFSPRPPPPPQHPLEAQAWQ